MGREGHHDLPAHPFRLGRLAAPGAQPHLDLGQGGGGIDRVRLAGRSVRPARPGPRRPVVPRVRRRRAARGRRGSRRALWRSRVTCPRICLHPCSRGCSHLRSGRLPGWRAGREGCHAQMLASSGAVGILVVVYIVVIVFEIAALGRCSSRRGNPVGRHHPDLQHLHPVEGDRSPVVVVLLFLIGIIPFVGWIVDVVLGIIIGRTSPSRSPRAPASASGCGS